MARMEILFDGFKDLAEQIDAKGKNLKSAVNDALDETSKIVQSNTSSAAASYAGKGTSPKGYSTGAMYRAIKKAEAPEWAGNVASVGVGFNLKQKGGFHSIFVMYGTPRMSKDPKVYNAIRGTKTKNQIAEAQEKVMSEFLKLGG